MAMPVTLPPGRLKLSTRPPSRVGHDRKTIGWLPSQPLPSADKLLRRRGYRDLVPNQLGAIGQPVIVILSPAAKPCSTGRTALNMVRFAEMNLKGRATCQTQSWRWKCPKVRDFAVRASIKLKEQFRHFWNGKQIRPTVPSPMNDVGQQHLQSLRRT